MEIVCGLPGSWPVGVTSGAAARETGRVLPVVIAILVALVVAGVVLLVASSTSARPAAPGRSPWQTFRAGLSGRKNPDDEQLAAAAAADAEPVDLTLTEFLRETVDEGEGYLQVEELQEGLVRARDKAARVIPRRKD